MPAKKKPVAHPFRKGEHAKVIRLPEGNVVDTGMVCEVAPMEVVFVNILGTRFAFKRKGDRWIEWHKDHYQLLPSP